MIVIGFEGDITKCNRLHEFHNTSDSPVIGNQFDFPTHSQQTILTLLCGCDKNGQKPFHWNADQNNFGQLQFDPFRRFLSLSSNIVFSMIFISFVGKCLCYSMILVQLHYHYRIGRPFGIYEYQRSIYVRKLFVCGQAKQKVIIQI